MSKQKSIWCCSECGHSQPKWGGQCPQCSAWNSLHEELQLADSKVRFEAQANRSTKPVRIKEVELHEENRLKTQIAEFDRLMGGGMVKGSLALVGGDPGIGKSTLLLQIASALAAQGHLVFYICAEESVSQTSLRARRLGIESDNLLLFSETNFSLIKREIDQVNPAVVIVDSIQLIYKSEIASAPGTVSQVRETASEFMHLAKGRGISTFLIGHVTKTGEIAGPRVLEHIVDTVLYFEGDKQLLYRMLRVVKNRFGKSDEIAVFQMESEGLKEVANPSQIFLEERRKEISGSAVIPTLEGSRPILVEVQALVTETGFATPSRRSSGLDQNRLALLLAVLEKRVGFQLYHRDVFVSLAGGIRIIEPAIDLGIAVAICSSMMNRVADPEAVAVGEIGLGGEVRSVTRIEARLKEAIHMGFKRCVIPKRNVKGLSEEVTSKIKITAVDMVEEAINVLIQ